MTKSSLRGFKGIVKVAILAIGCWLISNTTYAKPISSTELINDAKQYDGKVVTYEGEVIGDIMKRGPYAWLNISDGRNAIGIWIDSSSTKDIAYTGTYKSKGDKKDSKEKRAVQTIQQVSAFLMIKQFGNRFFNKTLQIAPFRFVRTGINLFQNGYGMIPQSLNLDRISLPGRSGRMIGIHPGIMRRAENQSGFPVFLRAEIGDKGGVELRLDPLGHMVGENPLGHVGGGVGGNGIDFDIVSIQFQL